jgi:hypothetical protein
VGDRDREDPQHDRHRPGGAEPRRRLLAFDERHQDDADQRQRERLVGELGPPEEEVAGAGVDGDAEAGAAGRAAEPGEEEEERGHLDQAGGADQDRAAEVGRGPGQHRQRRGRPLQARVVRGGRDRRVEVVEVVEALDLLDVEGVDVLVREGEERRVVDDLDPVERQPQQQDQAEALAVAGLGRGEPQEDRHGDQQDAEPIDQLRRIARFTRERVRKRAEEQACRREERDYRWGFEAGLHVQTLRSAFARGSRSPARARPGRHRGAPVCLNGGVSRGAVRAPRVGRRPRLAASRRTRPGAL